MLVEQNYQVYGRFKAFSEAPRACKILNEKGIQVDLNMTDSPIYQNYVEARVAMEDPIKCAVFDEQGTYIGSLAQLLEHLDR